MKEKYENECIKINGYIAQQNMLSGRELEKNNLKLEKAQSNVQVIRKYYYHHNCMLINEDQEYLKAVDQLQETVEKWNQEWRIGSEVSIYLYIYMYISLTKL